MHKIRGSSVPASHTEAPFWVLATLLHSQLPANVPEEPAEDGPNPWTTATLWETQKRFQDPGFRWVYLLPLQLFWE